MSKIYCDSCENCFECIYDNSIDLFLTDPPYKDYKSNRSKLGSDNKYTISAKGFSVDYLINQIEKKLKDDRYFFIFCDHYTFSSFFESINKSKILKYKNLLVWIKNNHGAGDLYRNYAPQHELVIFGSKGKGRKFNGKRPSNVLLKKTKKNISFYNKVANKQYNHITAKPIELLEEFIMTTTNVNDLIMDPYGGSFSLAEACLNKKRNFIVCENNLIHCKNSLERLNSVYSDKKIEVIINENLLI